MKFNLFKYVIFLLVSSSCFLCLHELYATNKFTQKFLEKIKPRRFHKIPGVLPKDYDKIYPYYIKYCSTTKFHPVKGKGIEGAIAGHAVYYLKGACKDFDHKPAGLKICPIDADYSDPNLGVGLSADKGLKNSHSFVIPGVRLFLASNLKEKEELNSQTKDRLVREALEKKIFEGYEFYDFMMPDSVLEKDREKFIANYVFGTDYALSMARNTYCINIPVNRTVMEFVVNELNALNESYKNSVGKDFRGIFFSGTKKDAYYHWHGIYNNCTHTIINIFAKLGILKYKSVDAPFFKQIHNIGIPSNTLLELHEKTNLQEIDIHKIFKNKEKRYFFENFSWLSNQAGVLAEKISVFTHNDLYYENDRMFVLPHLFKNRHKMIRDLADDPKFSFHGKNIDGLLDNITYYYEKYQRALEKINELKRSKKFKDLTLYNTPLMQQNTDILLKKSKEIEVDLNKTKKERKEAKAKRKNYEKQYRRLCKNIEYINFILKLEKFFNSEIDKMYHILSQALN